MLSFLNYKNYWLNPLLGISFSYFIFFNLDIHQDEFISFFGLKSLDGNFSQVKYSFGFNFIKKPLPFLDLDISQPFYYIGNIQGFLFYPFYQYFPLLEAKFYYSIINFFIIIYLFKKVLNTENANIIYLFFPLYITVLHDGGPVVTHLQIFLGIALLSKVFLMNSHKLVAFSAFVGIILLLFLGLFDKIFFIYLVPGIFLFSLSGITLNNKLLKLGLLVVFYLLFLTYSFLFVQIGFWELNYNLPNPVFQWRSITSLNHWPIFDTLKSLFQTFEIAFFVKRHFNVDFYYNYFPLGILGPILFLLLIFKIFRGVSRKSIFDFNLHYILEGEVNAPVFYFLSLISMILIYIVLGGIAFNHHTIFIFIPILAIFIKMPRGSYFKNLFLAAYFSQVMFFLVILFSFPKNVLLECSYKDLHSIINYQNREKASENVVNFNGWSYYFIESLNKDRRSKLVTNVSFNNKIEQKRLLEYCIVNKLKLINVYDNVFDKEGMADDILKITKKSKQSKLLMNSPNFKIYEFDF